MYTIYGRVDKFNRGNLVLPTRNAPDKNSSMYDSLNYLITIHDSVHSPRKITNDHFFGSLLFRAGIPGSTNYELRIANYELRMRSEDESGEVNSLSAYIFAPHSQFVIRNL